MHNDKRSKQAEKQRVVAVGEQVLPWDMWIVQTAPVNFQMIFPHSGRQLRPLSGLPRRLHQASTILGTITRLANLEARLRPTCERRVLRTRARVTLAVSTRQRGVERAEVLDARPMDDIVVRRLN